MRFIVTVTYFHSDVNIKSGRKNLLFTRGNKTPQISPHTGVAMPLLKKNANWSRFKKDGCNWMERGLDNIEHLWRHSYT
jgi:hypothetical protein